MAEIIRKIVAEEDNDIRLDRWFQRNYNAYSFANVSRLARIGQIRIDGKKIKASDRILAGQEVKFPECIHEAPSKRQIEISDKQSYQSTLDNITTSIIYINSHILVLNKPSGLAVQGGNGVELSVDHMAKDLVFDARDKPKLVHRIDKDTSGILILGRTMKATQELAEIFKNQRIKKTYIAITHNAPANNKGTIDLPLAKSTDAGFEIMIPSNGGQSAITHYKVLDRNGAFSLLELTPVTGRKHQIRAHLSAIDCPIIGDKKYSNKGMRRYAKMCLHAYTIDFQLFGEKINLVAQPPQSFLGMIKDLDLRFNHKAYDC